MTSLIDRRRFIVGAAGLAATGLLAATIGCARPGPTPSPSASPSPSGPPTTDETLSDLSLTFLFDQSATASGDIYALALVGERLLLQDDSGAVPGRLFAVDARTGAAVWTATDVDAQLTALDPRASLFAGSALETGPQAEVTPQVTYLDGDGLGGSSGLGVAAIELESGAVRWHAVVLQPTAQTDPGYEVANDGFVSVVGGSDDAIVVDAGLLDVVNSVDRGWQASVPQQPDDARIVALSATDGSTLWEAPGSIARDVVGDVVLAERRQGDNAVIVALDAASGDELWIGEQGMRWMRDATGPTVAIVEIGDAVAVIDMADGAIVTGGLTDVGSPAAGIDGLAWTTFDPTLDEGRRIVTFRDRGPALAGEEATGDFVAIHHLVDGYLWASVENADAVAFDPSGRPRSEAVPGFPRAVSSQLLVVDAGGGFAVYAID